MDSRQVVRIEQEAKRRRAAPRSSEVSILFFAMAAMLALGWLLRGCA